MTSERRSRISAHASPLRCRLSHDLARRPAGSRQVGRLHTEVEELPAEGPQLLARGGAGAAQRVDPVVHDVDALVDVGLLVAHRLVAPLCAVVQERAGDGAADPRDSSRAR
jgi:hypothetical protein